MTAPGAFPPASLIVSCQAQPESPFHGPGGMTLMARAAALGGAAGIRANGPADIAAIVAAVDLPVIGIWKTGRPDGVYITPTFEAAAAVIAAGATVVALDATDRPRPDGQSVSTLITRIRDELGVVVMADVDTVEAGVAAAAAGADLIASTLSGYTPRTATGALGPDIDLVAALASRVAQPVIAEGRYASADDVARAIAAGATAVVVGTAVTNPTAITRTLVRGARGERP
jgi:putative N-acetylmannosamine-6-phosphate epimerase